MSFILDALRKSESERQREAAPGLSHAPLATARRETPVWIWLVMGLLSAALIALAAAWWQSARTASGPGAAGAPAVTEPAVAGPAAAARSPAPAAAPAADPRSTDPRPVGELARLDPSLPEYRLEFVAYNGARPEQSSAWINGARYRPGERIGNGPELLEVRSGSVVLGYGGEAFLLSVR